MMEQDLLAVAVDDESMILTIIEEISREAGIKVVSFFSPEDALPFIQENDVDMIFTDYRMAQMDGISFIRELRRITEDIPIVMVTVFDDYNIMVEAIKAGATEFVPKPINAVEFLARVRNLAQLRRSQLLLREKAFNSEAEIRREIENAEIREIEELALLGRAVQLRPEDSGHSLRVAEYSRLISRSAGSSADDQNLVYHAALVHDFGRPLSFHNLITRLCTLSPEEALSVKELVMASSLLLDKAESLYLKAAQQVILSSFECFDGTGYPRGLKGADISFISRIVAVGETFDIMVMERSSCGAADFESVMVKVKERSGTHLDPFFVDIFYRHLEEVRDIHRHVRVN